MSMPKSNNIDTGPRAAEEPLSVNWHASALATVIKLNNIIGSLPLNLDNTLKSVIDEIFTLFEPYLCGIYIVGADNKLHRAAFRAADILMVDDVHVDDSCEACATLRDGLPYIGCSVSNYGAVICPNRKIPEGAPISHACIPMIMGEDINGVLSVAFQPERMLSRDMLNVLLSFANQVSATIQRSRLFERLENEKSEIERAYREISGLNAMLGNRMEELKRTQDRLIQSEKLAATGELSASLCHEINNPVSIILNRIECLKMESSELSLVDSVIKDLDVIYCHASKISTVVQDLLIFSRHHTSEFLKLDIRTVLAKVMEIVRGQADRNACVMLLNVPSSVPCIYGDSDRLEQVFRNLLANAIDAMPGGGAVHIDVEKPPGKGGIMVKVRDEGEGMEEGNLHRIFDPFYTTKKLGKGSGLGLSICYGIIENHGGYIKVKSEINKGSTFSVYLPPNHNRCC
jgi:signal transduction histidine kinase